MSGSFNNNSVYGMNGDVVNECFWYINVMEYYFFCINLEIKLGKIIIIKRIYVNYIFFKRLKFFFEWKKIRIRIYFFSSIKFTIKEE